VHFSPNTTLFTRPLVEEGEWTVMNGILRITNLSICQESRYEALKTLRCGYQLLRLEPNEDKWFWFNFDIDTMFFNTNAEGCCYYNQYLNKEYQFPRAIEIPIDSGLISLSLVPF